MLKPLTLLTDNNQISIAIQEYRAKAAKHYRPSAFNGYWKPWLKIYDRLEDRIIGVDGAAV